MENLTITEQKQVFEIRVESTQKARELVVLLNKNCIAYVQIMDSETLEWVFTVELYLDQLYLLKGKKTLEEICEGLALATNENINAVGQGALRATEIFSPVIIHGLKIICVTAIKSSAIMINDGCYAVKQAKKELNNDEVREAGRNTVKVVKGTAGAISTLYSWIKKQFNS